jgi:hypothetical protein
MNKFASIQILQYGKWTIVRQPILLSQDAPREHIVHILSELYLYSDMKHIEDVNLTVYSYDTEEDEDGNTISEIDDEDGTVHNKETEVVEPYIWSESDHENFQQYIEMFLDTDQVIF